jgi:plastocyanin
MIQRILMLGSLLCSVLLVSTAAADAPAAMVTIDNFSFTPAEITVAAGSRVTWVNRDDIPHTVTGADDPRLIRSPPLDTGESFTFTFAKPATYRYFCSLHAHMQGTVVVR